MPETAPEEAAEPKRRQKHAVVLSGGGANGAYEIGVLKALVAGKSGTTNFKPLEPDIFLGTSVGAYNAAFLASRWDSRGTSAVSDLEKIWLNDIGQQSLAKGNGAFRIRTNPIDVLNPFSYFPNPLKPLSNLLQDTVSVAWEATQRAGNIFGARGTPFLERAVNLVEFSSFISVDPLERLVHSTIQLDRLRNSSKKLRIAATNWALGKTQIFDQHDMTEQLGPQIIMASTAIPGIFPVQAVGAQKFVDGGVLMNTPLQPAIDAGADVIHVMTLNPKVEKIRLGEMSNTMSTAWRQQVISWVKAVDQNLLKIFAMNRTLELGRITIEALGRKETLDLDMSEVPEYTLDEQSDSDDTIAFRVDKGIWDEIGHYKPLTVFLHRPREDLGGPLGMLNFDAARLQYLVDRGFNDAKEFVKNDETYVSPFPIRWKHLKRYRHLQRLEALRSKGGASRGVRRDDRRTDDES
ncbi:MAG: hypothetical protein GY719_42035 [bacterium]|nr:hypothetical protein [bacterium]